MNFSIKNYTKPTPNSFRIIGDFIMTTLGTVAIPTIMNLHPVSGVILIGLGIMGQFLANCIGQD